MFGNFGIIYKLVPGSSAIIIVSKRAIARMLHNVDVVHIDGTFRVRPKFSAQVSAFDNLNIDIP